MDEKGQVERICKFQDGFVASLLNLTSHLFSEAIEIRRRLNEGGDCDFDKWLKNTEKTLQQIGTIKNNALFFLRETQRLLGK